MSRDSQPTLVLAYLRKHPFLTSAWAFRRWSITRLAHVIFVLRRKGHPITTVAVKRGQSSYAQYRLAR